MKSLQDVLYNWLTIKVVVDERPDDLAANDTLELFNSMLNEEHDIDHVEIEKDETMYYLIYKKDGEMKKTRFPAELIDVMINQINDDPEKYKNYPE
jgi:hypothetical protein